MPKAKCSTGIEYLDRLLGDLRIGDNVVWNTEAGSYVELFTEKFLSRSLTEGHSSIYVSFNRSPNTMVRKLSKLPNQQNITLLDCFTSGKGDNDVTFTRFYESGQHRLDMDVIKVENPADVSQFTEVLNEIEEAKGAGTRYVFDSMTGMQALWGDEVKTYKFFTYACPRLYDLDTVAYWILEKEAHTVSFKANLEHVTQVSLEILHMGGQLFLEITKAENRNTSNVFKPQKFDVWDDEIVFREAAEKDIIDLGGRVKATRLKRGLTQSELANRVGVTASYISQLERNLISPSIESLITLSNEMQMDPGYFISLDKSGSDRIVCRKNQRSPVELANVDENKMKCLSLVASTDNRRMQPISLTIEPGSEFSRHFFDFKGDEFILILKGELELDIEGKNYILREGDSVYLDSAVPTAWRNKTETPVQAVWVISPPIV